MTMTLHLHICVPKLAKHINNNHEEDTYPPLGVLVLATRFWCRNGRGKRERETEKEKERGESVCR